MGTAQEAYWICEEIIDDPDADEHAKSYAKAAKDRQMTGRDLDVQMNYIFSNTNNHKRLVASWLGIDPSEGYQDGCCQICGNRDGEQAYRGQDIDAQGLVCTDCYESYGPPDTCATCGTKTYSGDTMVRGENEGNFFCESCL